MRSYRFLGFVKTEFGVKTGVALIGKTYDGKTRAILLIAEDSHLRELVLEPDTSMLAELVSIMSREKETGENKENEFKEVDAGVV